MRTIIIIIISALIVNTAQGRDIKQQPSAKYLDSIYVFTELSYTDIEKAQNKLTEMDSMLNADNYPYNNAVMHLFRGIVERGKENNSAAYIQFRKSKDLIYPKHSNSSDAMYIYFCSTLSESDLLMTEYKFKESIELMYKLEKHFLTKNREWLIDIYNNIAAIYSEIEENELTIKYLEKALDVAIDDNAIGTMLTIKINLASIENINNNYNNALEILREMGKPSDHKVIGYNELEEMYWALMADCLYETGDYEASLKAINALDTIPEQDMYYRAKAYITHANIAGKQDDYKTVTANMLKAKAIFNQYNNPYFNKDLYENMFYIYKHNTDSVRKYVELFMAYTDTIRMESYTGNIVNLEVRKAMRELDDKYTELKISNLYQKKLTQNQFYIIILITTLLIATAVTLIVIRIKNRRLKFHLNRLIQTNKKIYEKQENTNRDVRIDDKKRDMLISEWEDIILNKELYKSQDITLQIIARKLKTNTSYLSESINSYYNKNFNKLINEYRIKESLKYFHNNNTSNYTIEYVATSSGFKSMSAFYRAFREYTGVTPSVYLKELNSKKGAEV
ncbi:MAG: helix-turn-helix transcriptional regulator [Bacteroidales bacterium]|jgi:AraC-like DNA-binding protein|nr:helix-turn-helix transcriptional regulator [Bacteroidales bacterium]